MKKQKKIIIILTSILIVLAFILLTRKYPETVSLIINGEEIILSQDDENTTIDLVTLNSLNDTSVKVKAKGKINIKVNNKKIYKYINNNIGKVDISNDDQINVLIRFKNSKTLKKYTINTLPSGFLNYTITGDGETYDGNYYMTTYTADSATSYIFALNTEGEVVYYRQTSGFCSQFRKEISKKGKIRYVYTAQDVSEGATVDMDNIYGKLVVMDENFEVIDEATYISNDKFEKTYTIFEYLDDGHYIVTASNKQIVNNVPGYEKVTMTQNNFQEIKNKKVLFEWKSEDYPELYEYIENIKELSKEGTNDYLHFNSIKVDPNDNNFLVSFRNISSILKIDRETGEIIWSLGGKKDDFNLTKKQKFGYQHSIYFNEDDSMMLFDNGDNRIKQGIKTESRIVKMKLNEQEMKLDEYKAYRLPNVYSMAMGSVQTMDLENNIFLVSYGSGIFTHGPVAMIDFNNNKTLFQFDLEANKMMFSVEKE